MNTKSTVAIASAAVTGARHVRACRNGQDAVATWRDDRAAVVVACDGCGSSASSELGAQLGARVFARALGERIAGGAAIDDAATWADARHDVVATLRELALRMAGDALHDHLLFTIIAAAARGDTAAVWALGDGAYAIDGATRTIGPFAGNAPPYVAYDLMQMQRPVAHFEVAPASWRTIVVATDGAGELDLASLADADRFVAHPDALRRHLAINARADERIDWDAQRVVRAPARLQDDCAIAILRRSVA